jgi:hypothetical protein
MIFESIKQIAVAGVAWFIRHSWIFLVAVAFQFMATFILLCRLTDITPQQGFFWTLNTFMGDSVNLDEMPYLPTTAAAASNATSAPGAISGVAASTLPHPPFVVAALLLFLRLSGWLLLPILIGTFLDQTKEEISRREAELTEREKKLLEREIQLEAIMDNAVTQLVDSGMEKKSASSFVMELHNKLKERVTVNAREGTDSHHGQLG